jgi:sRNA-binding carbon storage regulator CsrA
VLEVSSGRVRLGIDAPIEVAIRRREVVRKEESDAETLTAKHHNGVAVIALDPMIGNFVQDWRVPCV